MATTTPLTAEDLEQMREDGYRYELIRGVLKQMAPASRNHLIVSGRLISSLNQYLEPNDLGVAGGEGGFYFAEDPDTIFGPDVAVIPVDALPTIPATGYMRFVPPLVAEVVSTSNRPAEIEEKVRIYLAAGVKLVWVVDPTRRTIQVRTPDGADDLLTVADVLTNGGVFPEFRVEVARLFRWLM
ncbi:MAG: Uma2 family endonuclease [Chloroflexota bacterium]|nr:Uma2 family endonuclease [Chloroflexota bacterium]